MSFSVRHFFSTLFLSVIVEAKECKFYGKVIRNGKTIKNIKANFQSDDADELNQKMLDYIKRQQKEYKWVYISSLLDSIGQGTLPVANSEEFYKFGINVKDVGFSKIDEGWFIYADLLEIMEAKTKFKDYGLDFLYSPIALLHKAIMRRNESPENTLYIYNHKDCFALCVMDKKRLRFGSFAKTNETLVLKDKDEIGFDKENTDEIDEFIAQADDSFESLDDIESLDELFIKHDNEEEFKDLNYDLNMPTSSDVTASVSLFGHDMSMYQHIITAIKEFYTNNNYKSDFIEQIIIFDNEKTSATFLQFLESELLVQTTSYTINSLEIMTSLMIEEINL